MGRLRVRKADLASTLGSSDQFVCSSAAPPSSWVSSVALSLSNRERIEMKESG